MVSQLDYRAQRPRPKAILRLKHDWPKSTIEVVDYSQVSGTLKKYKVQCKSFIVSILYDD